MPALWLFTDARMGDPVAAIAALPRGGAGVVFRHDGDPDRRALGRRIARLCRERRLALAVAGDWRLAAALRAGLHLREGVLPAACPPHLPRIAASAHDGRGALRAARAGAAVIFLSPVFPTASHPGAACLGARGWCRLAGHLPRGRAAALGGVNGRTARRLAPSCLAAGAIDALSPGVERLPHGNTSNS